MLTKMMDERLKLIDSGTIAERVNNRAMNVNFYNAACMLGWRGISVSKDTQNVTCTT